MKRFILPIAMLLVLSACNQPKKTEGNNTKEATITKEQQEFCINTFKLYLDVDDERVEESQNFISLLLKHTERSNNEEETLRWYRDNLVHIDSVMHYCINLAERKENKKLLSVLEKERMNIVGHPNNTVNNEWQLYSVLALLYAHSIEDDKAYWTKVAELGEWSRMHIEAHQMNGKFHPLYKLVLNELMQIYEILGNQSKKNEIEKLCTDTINQQ